jgi:hypothetical protein
VVVVEVKAQDLPGLQKIKTVPTGIYKNPFFNGLIVQVD